MNDFPSSEFIDASVILLSYLPESILDTRGFPLSSPSAIVMGKSVRRMSGMFLKIISFVESAVKFTFNPC